MSLPKLPDIYEVGPRDGFQNIKEFIPTKLKIEIIEKILDAGVKRVQITSFVSPRAVPQMSDAQEVAQSLVGKYPGVTFGALVPNLYGARAAYQCGIREIAYVVSVSQSHNKANINRTHEQSFEELEKIRQEFPDMAIILGLATAFSCPFEGETPLEKTLSVMERGIKIGANIVELADTIGDAYPTQVERYLKAAKREFPSMEFGAHIHDTRNMGMLNTWVALQNGLNYIQTSIGGLGGCPFAPGASGNTSTEDFVYLLDKCGLKSGISFDKILNTAKFVNAHISGSYSGHQINIGADDVCGA